MADAGTRCPLPLQETNPGKQLCIKSSPTSCSSVVYSTQEVPYSCICGRVRGYQYESPDAFVPKHTGPKNINCVYAVYAAMKAEMMKILEWSFSKYLFTRQRGCVTKDCYM